MNRAMSSIELIQTGLLSVTDNNTISLHCQFFCVLFSIVSNARFYIKTIVISHYMFDGYSYSVGLTNMENGVRQHSRININDDAHFCSYAGYNAVPDRINMEYRCNENIANSSLHYILSLNGISIDAVRQVST